MRYPFFRLCSLLATVVILSSCAANKKGSTAGKPKPKAGRFMVGVKKSPFYKYGPAQAFGPDFALPQGQRLTLIEQSFGFSRVMTDDGLSGYMPTEDLVVASPEPPPPTPAAPRMASRRSPGGGAVGFYNGPVRKSRPIERVEDAPPLFDVFDMPLPSDPEPPKTPAGEKEKPTFRVN